MSASRHPRSQRPCAEPASGLRIAVVGAGLAGLTAAGALIDAGHEVVVLEKSRGAGGRMSTRREGHYRFDHGAQYFTSRDPRFRDQVRAWQADGLVKRWDGRIAAIDDDEIRPLRAQTDRFVGVPGMNAVCQHLAASVRDCRFGWKLETARQVTDGWVLESDNGDRLDAEVLLLTPPPAQISALVDEPLVHETIDAVYLLPCWALMAVFDGPLLRDWDAAFVNQGAISWLASQASKPARPSDHGWILHASPDWSRAHFDDDAESVIAALLDEAARLPGARQPALVDAFAHRWRYSLAAEPLQSGSLWFGAQRLAIAGDWCCGSRIEGAFLSGLDAAARITRNMARQPPGSPPGGDPPG